MNEQPNPVAATRFHCATCNQVAGAISLFRKNDGFATCKLEGFAGVLTSLIKPESFDRVFSAIENTDARTLYLINLEFAPFYCPSCAAVYCREHWRMWDVFDDDGWHEGLRGCCSKGHERLLMD